MIEGEPYDVDGHRTLRDPYGEATNPAHLPSTPDQDNQVPRLPVNWADDAACKGYDTNVFYPEEGPNRMPFTNTALAICRACPVRTPCLATATANSELGIWGGVGFRARGDLRRDARRAGVPLEPGHLAEWIDATDAAGTAVA